MTAALPETPMPPRSLLAGHIFLTHLTYVGDVKNTADLLTAHQTLHYHRSWAPGSMPHQHAAMPPEPVIATHQVDCDWCEEPITVGERVWWLLNGPAHWWHPGERP